MAVWPGTLGCRTSLVRSIEVCFIGGGLEAAGLSVAFLLGLVVGIIATSLAWTITMCRLASPRLCSIMEAGRQILILYEGERHMWHAMVWLLPSSPKALSVVMEEEAQPGDSVWWVLSPDGDVYPMVIG